MGPFSTTRNEPWYKNAESCLKITNNNLFFYRIMFLTCRQGEIKFEILWEPNFPGKNFARNKG